MPRSVPEVTAPRGHRRHRFMESTDFNGAARFIFDGLRRAVADGRTMVPAFMAVEMDPSTPGQVISVSPVNPDREDIALVMAAHDDSFESVTAGFRRLLGHPEEPASLVGYIVPADLIPGRPPGAAGLCLELRSVDGVAVAVFRIQPKAAPRARLTYAPLKFLNRLGG